MNEKHISIWEENKNTLPNPKNFKQEEIVKCDITNETKKDVEKNLLKDTIKKGGIYKIIHKETGKYYVGSTVCFRKRWITHRYKLNNNLHENKHLQNAWNLYGKNAFEFIKVEYIDDKQKLLIVEQNYLDKIKYDFENKIDSHYNQRYDAFKVEMTPEIKEKIGNANRGRKHTDVTKLKMSKSRTGKKHWAFGKKRSEEFRKLLSERSKGRKISDETKIKMSFSRKGSKNPFYDSNIYHFYNKNLNLHKYCTKYELKIEFNIKSNLSALFSGRRSIVKGWILIK
jgi:group I intron endonuclease